VLEARERAGFIDPSGLLGAELSMCFVKRESTGAISRARTSKPARVTPVGRDTCCIRPPAAASTNRRHDLPPVLSIRVYRTSLERAK